MSNGQVYGSIRHLAPEIKHAYISQVAVQNTYYTILDEKMLDLLFIGFWVNDAENIQVRLTFDSMTPTVGSQSPVVATTWYWADLNEAGECAIVAARVNAAYYMALRMRSCKIEIRKTSNVSGSTIHGHAIYGKW